MRRRQTTEAVIGGATGTMRRPQLLVLGRYDEDGRLRAVGRTTPLKPDGAQQLADHLTEAAPTIPGPAYGSPPLGAAANPLDPILVIPELIAEISAETAIERSLAPPAALRAAAPGRHGGRRAALR
ncbi:hypothetical protein [Streptomyces spiramyceticus]|uniref:hypothetical protein n=1 Tax=Streptomyces spiramyceticus TaxID=299717 RepID=UPI00237B5751|nr:hypothetical protein [Streptomyces spiramyceticus]